MKLLLARHLRFVLVSPTGRTFLANGAILALGFVTSTALARWLGPPGRGELAAALLWPPLLAGFAQLGLSSAITYEAASGDSDGNTVFGVAAALGLVQSVIAIALGHALLPFMLKSQASHVVQAAQLFLWVVPLTVLTQYGLSLLAAKLQFVTLNILRLITPLGYLASAFVLHGLFDLTPESLVRMLLGFNALTLIGTLAALVRLRIVRRPRFERGVALRLTRYGGKVYVGSLAYTANARFDQVVISGWFAPAHLGLYVTALSAASISQVLTHAVQQVLMPTIAGQSSAGERASGLRRAFRKYLLVSASGNAMLLVAVPFLIPIVFGPEFRQSVVPAMVLVVAMSLLGAKDVLTSGAQALNDPWLGSRAELAGAGVVVIALVVLVPLLGILGAAIAALISYGTQLAIVLVAMHRRHALPLHALVGSGGSPPRASAAEMS